VAVPQRKGDPIMISIDEGVRGETTAESLSQLRGAFEEGTARSPPATLPDLRRRRGGPGHVGRALRTTRPHAPGRTHQLRPGRRPRRLTSHPAFARHPSGGKKADLDVKGSGPLRDQRGVRGPSASPRWTISASTKQGQRERRGHRARSPGRMSGTPPRALGVDRTASTRRRRGGGGAPVGGGGQGDAGTTSQSLDRDVTRGRPRSARGPTWRSSGSASTYAPPSA